MKKLLSLVLSFIFLFSFVACSNPKTNETSKETQIETQIESQKETLKESQDSTNLEKDTIVTTFYPVYEFTREIMGDLANVELLIQAGNEVHGYEPSAKDIAKISEADVFVYEDPNMETWVPKLLESIKKDEKQVIKATKDLILLPGGDDHDHHHHEGEDHHHEFDPHLWVSPYRSIKLVENIGDGLIENYPDHKDTITKNAEAYLTKLQDLHKKYTDTLSNAKQKYFVTQHTAFAYLALDYGLTQVSINGLAADVEPTITRLKELSDYVKEYGIKYIYFEENAKKSVAETLAKETGAQLEVLNPLESLTKEQMDAGKTYLSIMEDNLAALEKTTSQEGVEIKPEDGEDEDAGKTVYNGWFKDEDVKDRTLSDYAGEWRSVYPLLLEGKLDQVFDYKSKISKSMTAEEYKEYYNVGYKTDVETINIYDNTMEFVINGQGQKFTYEYKGYEILQYKKGNRGVRFLFETNDPNAGQFKYVQFSDHNIAPVKTLHFHIYFGGESQEKLLEEMDNWPTYYPKTMTDHEIGQEMMAH